ncbi:KH domain-containing protein [Dolichospermum sp. ST_con]|nr:KH domain-containing protein [Dolichospermum sp. ST_con]MDD1419613.1 KH domain-containing protein [Dolichospermum sp. ST_sed1]MDD1422903.1 KH domain-containing protein [Dolichospermum sp. ST_sed9]MDD1430658.1 KH domain-containing protein [Dolichospermum sp. ST_sed6]MDD1439452.1 KH domain-containing protein [Dolichospermum sp. ST_sed3]MDD1445853.1 KH domain-containing protein [Dolichospermum sp. ST_sed8]MDD1453910.1 KH domain-containing protein [Dolichospermum sp. ST_sed7]MDD1459873.1 KH d
MQQPHHSFELKSLATSPNYVGLVQFLVQPFLESPESLSVDCEVSQVLNRIWIRIAFDSTDKEKVFGRGGRNIQAIRTVIATAAELAGQSVYLDIYGTSSQSRDSTSFDEDQEERILPPKSKERENNIPKPVVKPRLR